MQPDHSSGAMRVYPVKNARYSARSKRAVLQSATGSLDDIQNYQAVIFTQVMKPLSAIERLHISYRRKCLQVAICIQSLHVEGKPHGCVSPSSLLYHEIPSKTAMSNITITLRNQGLLAAASKGVKFMHLLEPTRYMPPEYFEKDEVAPTNEGDLFSWATLTYAILSGEPFLSSKRNQQCIPIVATRSCFTRLVKPEGVPDVVWSLLHECWKKEPSERPSITDVVTTLQTVRPLNENEL
ncbi:kinase-like domain-containing protein [Cyathus striatus]|nr:kinase-like domain-containing protein [Cyathus striatus]